MNKNIQIINLINGSEQVGKIEIDKTSVEICAYFLKNIIKEFVKTNGDINKILNNYSSLSWTSKSVCDMCVCDKGELTNEK